MLYMLQGKKTLELSYKTLVVWDGVEIKSLDESQVQMTNTKTGEKYALKLVGEQKGFRPKDGTRDCQ